MEPPTALEPLPPVPVIVTVGADVYPLPAFVANRTLTASPPLLPLYDVAAAPVPPPPLKVVVKLLKPVLAA